jgi:RimJ/RimL family protein N-acetyltransferase
VADPDGIAVAFGDIVRFKRKGKGLGTVLMRKLIRILREPATRRRMATVRVENRRMLALARSLGFVQHPPETAGGRRVVVLELQPALAAEAGS